MDERDHPWELIFRNEGRVFLEPFPAFEEVAAEFSLSQCRHILDLGCGTGRHVVALQKRGFSVTGLDISISGLSQTRDWLKTENLSAGLVNADTRRFFPFRSGSFDGVISTQVIHHAMREQVRLSISEMYRVMARGAVAFVSVAGRLPEEKLVEYEVEPGTIIPHDGREKGLPHHLFTIDEARVEFGVFHITKIEYRDEGKVLAMWLLKE